jgi:predicted DNA-binding transcriptional regulator AlpA
VRLTGDRMIKFWKLDDLISPDKNGARRVPVSRATIYRMIRAGEFPAPCKIGRGSFWSECALEKWTKDTLGKADE